MRVGRCAGRTRRGATDGFTVHSVDVPGRCTDVSEAGVGAVVAGEMCVGQQVAVELRLPNVGVPVRARALVRYQSRLRCGLQFVGLSVDQREMIRYWVHRSAAEPVHSLDLKKIDLKKNDLKNEKKIGDAEIEIKIKTEAPEIAVERSARPVRKIRIGRRGFVPP